MHRLLSRIDADVLDLILGTWMWTRTALVNGRRIIALDGKTVRRTRPRRPQ